MSAEGLTPHEEHEALVRATARMIVVEMHPELGELDAAAIDADPRALEGLDGARRALRGMSYEAILQVRENLADSESLEAL